MMNKRLKQGARRVVQLVEKIGNIKSPLSFINKKQNASHRPAEKGRKNFGIKLQRQVEKSINGVPLPDFEDIYAAIKPEFDHVYYLSTNSDLTLGNVDCVAHYIKSGEREGRKPTPYFSPRRYCDRYADVESGGGRAFYHWLTEGREQDRIALDLDSSFDGNAEVNGRQPHEIQALLHRRFADVRHRLENGELGEMVEKAALIEPLIAGSWPKALEVASPPCHRQQTVSNIAAMHSLHAACEHKTAKAVIVVNRPRWGGGKRMEGWIAASLARKYGPEEIVVIASEHGGEMPPDKFDQKVRYVEFPEAVSSVADNNEKLRILVEFIRSLAPLHVFNINSRSLWQAMTPYGKALSQSTQLIGCLFCNEQNALGYWNGYPLTQFYRHFDVLDHVCVDSHFLADQLKQQFAVPDEAGERIVVLSAPVEPGIEFHEIAARSHEQDRPKTVFWAGRFDRQKRVDVAYAVARNMPDVQFRLWGEAAMDANPMPPPPENVVLEGKYDHFSQVPLSQADAWLYTSEWDGVPGLLLEVAMTGIPIVASKAGGTPEIIGPETGWLVNRVESVKGYVQAITEILADPQAAGARASKLRQDMMATRTHEQYDAGLWPILERSEP